VNGEAVSPRAQEVTEFILSHVFRSSEREAVSQRAQEVTESIFSHVFRSSEREAVSPCAQELRNLYFLTCSGLVNGKQSRHVLRSY
jgi:hypothetical protein